MEAAKKTLEQEATEFLLKVIYGGRHSNPPHKQKRINHFWDFCHSLFWKDQTFSEAEIQEFKRLIAEHFEGTDNANEKFRELIQRAVLVKRYLTRRSGRYMAKPLDWLNVHFMAGLAGTGRWYEELAEQRKTVPHYNEGIAFLADAILNFSRHGNTQEIEQYREVLLKLRQFDLAAIYTNAIMHMLFI